MSEKRLTDHDRILNYLRKNGASSKLEIGNAVGTTKADTRISELRRAGYDIRDKWEPNTMKAGRHKVYWLVESEASA